jgi:RimJ/RimL family protein N-acetyltransferase
MQPVGVHLAATVESSLRGRHVYLRAVLPGEYEDLYLRETSGDQATRGGLEGSTPAFEDWLRQRSTGILARFVVLAADDHRRLGLVTLFNADLSNGHAHLALSSFDPTKPSPFVMMGCGLLIQHAFSCWPLHKLYLDVAEYNLAQFSTGVGRLFEPEGRLKDHHYQGGRRWDHHILSISRERWSPYWRKYADSVLVEDAA